MKWRRFVTTFLCFNELDGMESKDITSGIGLWDKVLNLFLSFHNKYGMKTLCDHIPLRQWIGEIIINSGMDIWNRKILRRESVCEIKFLTCFYLSLWPHSFASTNRRNNNKFGNEYMESKNITSGIGLWDKVLNLFLSFHKCPWPLPSHIHE